MPSSPCVSMSCGAFARCFATGGRGVSWSMLMFACRLGILLPFAAGALRPDDANAQIQIFTRNHTPLGQRTSTLDVDESDSIETVKQKNQGKLGYLPQDQFLFYAGTFLQDGRTLSDYAIGSESTVDMSVIDAFAPLSFSGYLPGSALGFSPFIMRSGTSGTGDGWSVFNYTNAVDLSATGAGFYTLNLFTVTPAASPELSDAPGEMLAFDGRHAYSWTFITATGGISGFSPDQFVVDTEKFANAFTGSFSVVQQGNSLAISYSPAAVPEIDLNAIGSVLAFVTGAFGLVERRRRVVA